MGHELLSSCIAALKAADLRFDMAAGYVRHASSSEIPDLQNGAITVGRENAEDGDGKQ